MADALCGPSNALQNFQKHSSVDRTLQQDRLVGRHSPSQGFRSPNHVNSGALDLEFEAFQAGHAGPPQLQPPPHLAFPPQPPPQFAHSARAPDWASDFQRLNITTQPAPALQQHHVPPAPASWHQDFMRQQGPVAHAPAHQQQNGFGGGISGYGVGGIGRPSFQQPMSFGRTSGGMASDVAQGKQRAQEPVAQLDDAAFEHAFAEIELDSHAEPAVLQTPEQGATTTSLDHVQHNSNISQGRESVHQNLEEFERQDIDVMPGDARSDDPVLLRIREQRPAVYAALKIRSALDGGAEHFAVDHLTNLEWMEQENKLVADASEARWIIDTLQNILDRGAAQSLTLRVENLIRAINERLMSTYPLLSSHTHTRGPVLEHMQQQHQQQQQQPEQQPEQQQNDEQPLRAHDEDEMADTAGRLLERVADNTSAKFQNSQFLSLMRKLRDREVKVEGDKMVEVSARSSSPTTATTPSHRHTTSPAPPASSSTIPAIDPTILHHAATDFALPDYPDQDGLLPGGPI